MKVTIKLDTDDSEINWDDTHQLLDIVKDKIYEAEQNFEVIPRAAIMINGCSKDGSYDVTIAPEN